MLSSLRWLGLPLLALAFVLPATGADEKDAEKKDKGTEKKDAEKKPDAKEKAEPKEKLVQVASFPGVFKKIDNQKLSVTVKERAINNQGKLELRDKTMEFELAEDLKVRVEVPPLAFDDKGRTKKYTKAELDEFKGPDKKLFGYNGDLDSLKENQPIQVFLGRKKSAPKTEAPVVFMIWAGRQP